MEIVDFKTFVRLPADTIFAPFIEVLKWAKNGCKGDNPGEYRG